MKGALQLSPKEAKVIKVTGFVLGFSILGLLTHSLIKRKVRKAQVKSQSQQSLNKMAPAAFATRLKMAMEGYGTSEENIRAVFRELDDWKHYREVARAYSQKYGSLLEEDLEDELTETEFQEITEIANSLKLPSDQLTQAHVEAWGKRLQSAWNLSCWIFPCTDEDAAYSVLRDILRSPSPKLALQRLEVHYRNTYLEELQADAEYELDSQELQKWNALKSQIRKL